MAHRNIIDGESEEQVWDIITEQLKGKNDNRDYTAQLSKDDYCITLDIDMNPDRGEEEEKQCTSFTAQLPDHTNFRFRIEKQGFKHELGKLFGVQDVVIGHPEFDKAFLIQSNEPAKVKKVLSGDEVPVQLLKHPVVNFQIRERKIGVNKDVVLDLCVEGVITETDILKGLFQSFKLVLNKID